MLPENGAALEYWDAPKNSPDLYRVFFHAAAEVAAVQAAGSRWRLHATSLTLAPGETARRGVRFLLVDGYAAMRRTIAEHGLIDVEVVPGMTVPTDLEVTLSLGSRVPVVRLEPEHSIPNGQRLESGPGGSSFACASPASAKTTSRCIR